MNLWGVQRSQLKDVWPKVGPLLEWGLKRSNRLTAEMIKEALEKGEAQLWVPWDQSGIRAACVTEIYETSLLKRCHVLALAGSGFKDWLPCLETIEKWAKAKGCELVTMTPRKGLEQHLKGMGYKTPRLCMEKEI